MGKVLVQGFVATTGIVPKYGRALLDEQAVTRIFEQLRDGRIQSSFGNHDERNPIETTIKNVELRHTENGALGVWMEVEADEAAMSNYGGWSIGWFENEYTPLHRNGKIEVRFGADAAEFTDDERALAAEQLSKAFEVYGGRYYQLGEESPATVVVMLLAEALKTIPADILGHLLYEALSHLLPNGRRSKPSLFKFSVLREEGRTEVRGLLETSDATALRAALNSLIPLASNEPGNHEFDAATESWLPIAPPSANQTRRTKPPRE